MGNLVNTLAFPRPDPEYSRLILEQRQDKVNFPTASGEQIFALDIDGPGAEDRPAAFTIIYSHGNAEDVGLAVPYLEELAETTQCNVFAYEYKGYSLTEGQPSESGVYESINAAFDYLTQKKRVDPKNIFIFGRSIGSGPSVDLASRHVCAGLILQSPLESGARAVFGNGVATVGSFFDIFKNINKIGRVKMPTCIIHGEADEVVPCSNGKGLHAIVEKKGFAYEPLWIPMRGHNDMPERDCLRHVAGFVDHVEKTRQARA